MKNPILALFLLLSFPLVWGQSGTTISSGTITFNFVEKDVDGSISGFESTSKIDPDNLENSTIKGSVAVETLDTNNFLRNWSLKGSKYFDADAYPKIFFESTLIKVEGSTILATGRLTIKDISKPITITFTKNGNTLKGTTTLFSSDFGITILKKGRESNKVTVRFNLKLK
ncbi:YceI family protein [Maribacter sp. 2210JD10-5]|uniref:YceI family protein n=1 Tax=Maribacter sp. 2210JD10-5 TaxID=3386272 RepID=UPI0039BC2C26